MTHITNTGWMRGIALAAVTLIPSLSATQAHAQATIGLYELARFNLSSTSQVANPQYIGSNPAAVGWNGSKLFVAGVYQGAGTGTASIVEITNASSVTSWTASGIVAPTFSSTFASGTFVATRGYTGLSMKDSSLIASIQGGQNRPTGLQAFNAATNTKLWDLSNSGTTTGNIGTAQVQGPDFDPGYPAQGNAGAGVGWLINGASGRRLLNDASTGAAIYTTTANVPVGASQGMALNGTFTGWRDIAFDPATGDVYARNNNVLQKNVRTGSNSVANFVDLGGLTNAPNIPGQNVGFMNSILAGGMNAFSNPYSGDLLVVNDRSVTTTSQSWTSVVKFFTTSGSAVTPSYTFLSTPLNGNGWYDFEWDSTTQTLAVMDYQNRTVSLFSTAVPEPSTWAMLITGAGACGGMGLRRRMRRRG